NVGHHGEQEGTRQVTGGEGGEECDGQNAHRGIRDEKPFPKSPAIGDGSQERRAQRDEDHRDREHAPPPEIAPSRRVPHDDVGEVDAKHGGSDDGGIHGAGEIVKGPSQHSRGDDAGGRRARYQRWSFARRASARAATYAVTASRSVASSRS